MESIDIKSKGEYPANALLNCAEYHFVFDGIECASMEGFLQSLKIRDKEEQKKVCKMVGIEAELYGEGHNEWKKYQTLYWKGERYFRQCISYLNLLERAYLECFKQNEKFREALLSTGNKRLIHGIGKRNPYDTILTKDEFREILTNLRNKHIRSNELKQLSVIVVWGLIVASCLYFYIGPSLRTIFGLICGYGIVAVIYYGPKLFRHWMKLEKM